MKKAYSKILSSGLLLLSWARGIFAQDDIEVMGGTPPLPPTKYYFMHDYYRWLTLIIALPLLIIVLASIRLTIDYCFRKKDFSRFKHAIIPLGFGAITLVFIYLALRKYNLIINESYGFVAVTLGRNLLTLFVVLASISLICTIVTIIIAKRYFNKLKTKK